MGCLHGFVGSNWRAEVYLNGRDATCEGYVSVFLRLNDDVEAEEIKTSAYDASVYGGKVCTSIMRFQLDVSQLPVA